MRRVLTFLLAAAVAASLVATGWWAGRVALSPPEDPLVEAVSIEYTVDVGSVGRVLSFAAVAEWPLMDLGRGAAFGTVTSIAVESGASVAAGDVLYTVDLRPVVVAEGVVPSFRAMSYRSEGPDVAQLQRLLVASGLLDDEVDGVFGRSTRDAVKLWQESLGVEADGVVRRGDVMFVEGLPARVVLDSGVVVGAELSGVEVTVRQVAGDPVFEVPLAFEQRGLVPLSADVKVTHGGGVWDAVITEAIEDEVRGELRLMLAAPDGGAVCGPVCAETVALEVRTDFPARVVVVPETTGPLVPVAAILTAPDGSASVTIPGFGRADVVVLAVSNGLAVVDGLEPGDVILLPTVEGS